LIFLYVVFQGGFVPELGKSILVLNQSTCLVHWEYLDPESIYMSGPLERPIIYFIQYYKEAALYHEFQVHHWPKQSVYGEGTAVNIHWVMLLDMGLEQFIKLTAR
jgi:hypothetical protein